MAEENFVHKTLDKLLEVIEVELKLPLGIAEVKMSPTAIAKEWRENQKKRSELESAIQRAEEKFTADHKDKKVAQMLHELPLHSEGEFKQVIAGLLTNLSEEKITWLAEINLKKTWGSIANTEEIRKALALYLPYLRHELNSIKEFREVISALTLERIDETTGRIDKRTERMEGKLDEALKLKEKDSALAQLNTGWFYGHRYGDLATFTGRAAELKMLGEWLENEHEALLMIRALGGFGKSALAWTWFNRVDREQWQTAVWWSFYEKESGFESFLAETLKHLGVEVKESARQQVNDLLEAMRGTNILIVLDGFERLLRQYGRMDAALVSDDEDADIDPSQRDCSSPLTETFLRGLSGAGTKSKVLMTTRLCPRILESADGKLLKGCRDEALSAFSPEDAVTYFHKEGIAATRAEILAACSAYGYHPLSLSLLVGLINEDHEHRGDIAAVKNLEIFEDVKARRHHVLERAYESLAPERRDLLSKISCFRGSMEYAVLKKVFPSPDLDKAMLDLRKRGLLQYAGESQRYDMHPIVRHYAYDHFTDEKRRKEAHLELAEHFIDAVPATNKNVKTLEDLAPVIELYHHMVRAGNLDEAVKLFYDRLHNALYYQFGAYQLITELLRALFLDGEDKPPRLKREDAQAWTLNGLANTYSMNGQPRRAVPLFDMTNDIYENRMKNKQFLATGLGNVAQQQLVIGALNAAERNLLHRIDLCREIEYEYSEAIGHRELGRVLFYRGEWNDSEQEIETGTKLFEKQNHIQSLSVTLSYRALRFLLMTREDGLNVEGQRLKVDKRKSQIENQKSSIQCAQRALELADETAKPNSGFVYPIRDYIRAYWLLGAAYLVSIRRRWSSNPQDVSRPAAYSTTELESLTLAEENLSKALTLCRQINAVDAEADILLDLARLRYAQGDFKDAQEKASEARVITQRGAGMCCKARM